MEQPSSHGQSFRQWFPWSKRHYSLRETQNKKTRYPHLTTPERQKASDQHLLTTPTQENCSSFQNVPLDDANPTQHLGSKEDNHRAPRSPERPLTSANWQLETQQPATKPWRSKRTELSPPTLLSLLRVTVTTGLNDHKTRLSGVNTREQAKRSCQVNR